MAKTYDIKGPDFIIHRGSDARLVGIKYASSITKITDGSSGVTARMIIYDSNNTRLVDDDGTFVYGVSTCEYTLSEGDTTTLLSDPDNAEVAARTHRYEIEYGFDGKKFMVVGGRVLLYNNRGDYPGGGVADETAPYKQKNWSDNDLTLAEARTHDGGGFPLTFNGLSQWLVNTVSGSNLYALITAAGGTLARMKAGDTTTDAVTSAEVKAETDGTVTLTSVQDNADNSTTLTMEGARAEIHSYADGANAKIIADDGKVYLYDDSTSSKTAGAIPRLVDPATGEIGYAAPEWETVGGVIRPKAQPDALQINDDDSITLSDGRSINSYTHTVGGTAEYIIIDLGDSSTAHDHQIKFGLTPSAKASDRARGIGLINGRTNQPSYFSWQWMGEDQSAGVSVYAAVDSGRYYAVILVPAFARISVDLLLDENDETTAFSHQTTAPSWLPSATPANNEVDDLAVYGDLDADNGGTNYSSSANWTVVSDERTKTHVVRLTAESMRAFVATISADGMHIWRRNGTYGTRDGDWGFTPTAQRYQTALAALLAALPDGERDKLPEDFESAIHAITRTAVLVDDNGNLVVDGTEGATEDERLNADFAFAELIVMSYAGYVALMSEQAMMRSAMADQYLLNAASEWGSLAQIRNTMQTAAQVRLGLIEAPQPPDEPEPEPES